MKPQLLRIGAGEHPVVVVDDFSGDIDAIRALAAALAPFPPARNFYPGLRAPITSGHAAAWDYVVRTLNACAPFVGGGFNVDSFDLMDASFSMVTAEPGTLAPAQRVPHFDTFDPKHLAVLHYLSNTPRSGTAFFRHRATGVEAIDGANAPAFIAAASAAGASSPGYIQGSTDAFEEIGRVEARPNRLIIYQGRLLHSGVIPPGLALDADPLTGRLTANLFIQGH